MVRHERFKRGPPPRYPDVGTPGYGGYTRTPYPQKVKLSKDPRMMMEYRRPLFIFAGTVRRFLSYEEGIVPASAVRNVIGIYPTLMNQISPALERLKPDLSGLTTLAPQNTISQSNTDPADIVKALAPVLETVVRSSTSNRGPASVVKKILRSPRKKRKKRRKRWF